ncbi:MAG: zinc-dependent dehydrogenase [Bifidobacteriaceae bacterium]|jgi:threonine dehydrogenase-like Zn-dependent dehydrogenase|nr:zinc-dependent dehydrogenase [Bifidobacteriaceae bacterium]
MKAAVFHRPGDIRLEEVPEPEAGSDGLVVEVAAASVCGTDLRVCRHGHFRIPDGVHRILGHEIVGRVVEVGAGAGSYRVGDRLSFAPNIGCGDCRFCRLGLNNMCPDYEALGVTIDGAFAERMRVPGIAIQRGNVFRVPESVSDAAAALTEPLSCCLRGQDALQISPEDSVVVVGTGPIGVFHILLARLAGAKRIIAANKGVARLGLAGESGADVLVDVDREDLAEVVSRETSGRGADVVITCVSNAAVQSAAVDLLATHGRVNFFAGLGGGAKAMIDTNRVHYKGLVLTGTTGSANSDYERALALVAAGRINPEPLVSRVFRLADALAAFDHAASGEGMKPMILPGLPSDSSAPA